MDGNRKVNYKSDFDFILRLVAPGADGETVDVGFPAYDWEAVIRSGNNMSPAARSITASCKGGVCTNCFNDDGRIHVVANAHGLYPGVLHVEFFAHLPNGIYPDNEQLNVTPQPIGIELVTGAGDEPTAMEVEMALPGIYRSAYDMAVENGYEGTMEEYVAAAVKLPTAVETAAAVRGSVGALEETSRSLDATAKALELLSSEFADGRQAIAEALTNRDYPTEPTESFSSMARKIEGMSYGAGWLAEIGYKEDNNSIRGAVQYARDLAKGWNPDGSTPALFSGNKRLVFAPWVDTGLCTSFYEMFRDCTSLVAIPSYDTENVVRMDRAFMSTGIGGFPMMPTRMVSDFSYMFYGCKNLMRVELLDFHSVTNILSNTFHACDALGYMLIRNLGESSLTSFAFTGATAWGTGPEENRQSLVDSLVTCSYDRAAAGMATATISLSANTKALLTDEEIAQITAKGFTIS